MKVYVESNFVLELAFQRDEEPACQQLLQLAEVGKVQLAIPTFCVVEPYEAIVRRAKQREETHNKLKQELSELARSKPYRESPQDFQELTSLLLKSNEEEKLQLEQALTRVMACAAIIPLDYQLVAQAITLQSSRSLSPQDALVYASVLKDLQGAGTEQHCFITKNSKDFVNPDIISDLLGFNCKLLTRFRDGLGYLQSCLK